MHYFVCSRERSFVKYTTWKLIIWYSSLNTFIAWYDAEIKSYQKVRTATELEKVFEEKLTPGGTKIDIWQTKEDEEGELKIWNKISKN